MRTFKALKGGLVLAAIVFAGPAAAFDLNNLDADTPPGEALRFGLDSYRSGDTEAAIEALNFAAEKGLPSARWKLGQMYAQGDGVERDEYHAFELFSELADAHADDSPDEPTSAYVSNSFVQLGTFYRKGIPNSRVKPDLGRARQFFAYAASYFGDPSAQLNLARMYYGGEGGDRDLIQAAKWANLSADKGNRDAEVLLVDISIELSRSHLDAGATFNNQRQALRWATRAAQYGSPEGQALLGHLLFQGIGTTRQPVQGLMYLTVALDRAGPDVADWILDMHAEARSAATEDEWNAAKQLADEWLANHPAAVAANVGQ